MPKMKKIGLTGLGLLLLTKEEVDKFVNNMIKKGKIDSAEGKRMARALISKSKKQSAKVEKDLQRQIKQVMDKMDLARKSEVDKLKKQVAELKKKTRKRPKKR